MRAVVEEAGKLAAEVLDPLNRVGDRQGSRLVDGTVATPPGWKEAYDRFVAGGWSALPPEEYGGQGLPEVVSMAACEIWNAANLSFGLCPLLTQGAIDALVTDGSEAEAPVPAQDGLRGMDRHHEPDRAAGGLGPRRAEDQGGAPARRHLPAVRDQDLHHVRRPRADRKHRPHGARAAAGRAPWYQGHFAVPGAERLVAPDGTWASNDVACAGLEHKLGIHGSRRA